MVAIAYNNHVAALWHFDFNVEWIGCCSICVYIVLRDRSEIQVSDPMWMQAGYPVEGLK